MRHPKGCFFVYKHKTNLFSLKKQTFRKPFPASGIPARKISNFKTKEIKKG